MKQKWKLLAACVCGMLIGSAATFIFMGHQVRWLMAFFAEGRLVEVAQDARLIRTGRSDAVLKQKDEAIPLLALTFEREHAKYVTPEARLGVMWAIQRYYSDNPSIITTPELKAVLDALPPRPLTCCELDTCTTQPATTQPGTIP
jgi:hypothetical protein